MFFSKKLEFLNDLDEDYPNEEDFEGYETEGIDSYQEDS